MKKKVICRVLLFSTALCLAGCGGEAPAGSTMIPTVQQSTASSAAPRETAATSPTEEIVVTDPTEITEAAEQEKAPALPVFADSVPQEGAPIVPQPGDTAVTWNPERQGKYPEDEQCTDRELLEKWMDVEGITWEMLRSWGCRQLVLTVCRQPGQCDALIVCYEEGENGTWERVADLPRMEGFVGKKGIAHARRINSYQTPAGLWGLGTAFGNEAAPEGLKMPWRPVQDTSYWVGDVDSRYFNTWQEISDPALTEAFLTGESEHLADYPGAYAYACAIGYNTPPYTVTERGCAIFFHCGEDYTAGCVALPESDFLQVLLWLDPGKTPCILITGQAEG